MTLYSFLFDYTLLNNWNFTAFLVFYIIKVHITPFFFSIWQREDAAQLHQFILHAALDVVQDLAWTTSAM